MGANLLPKRFLPMAWHVERVSPGEVYTFRWGRGSGVFTVHRGDIGSSHSNDRRIETVRIGRDWTDAADVATQARLWLSTRVGPRRRNA
ncbi:hypothetical protein [Saccharopolyspora sp. 5N708]|uniref:hypothetical protein n=1 Tax=Saccharopolyspora sp. 5N708 TaxID=3457424 RepID=UPI003FD680E5